MLIFGRRQLEAVLADYIATTTAIGRIGHLVKCRRSRCPRRRRRPRPLMQGSCEDPTGLAVSSTSTNSLREPSDDILGTHKVGVGLATLRKWEDGQALPERSLWQQLEEAMGMPVPDPRVPDHTPAERELIDTILLMVDELRLLRERMAEATALEQQRRPKN